MASVPPVDFVEFDEPTIMHELGRSALWAGFAIAALIAAILTARSEVGVRRINEALNLIREPAEAVHAPVPPIAYDPVAEAEARRLAERVRVLSADRDRLLARLDAVEHAIEVTGSVQPKGPAPVPSPPANSLSSMPAPASSAPSQSASSASAESPQRSQEPPAPSSSVTILPPRNVEAPPIADESTAQAEPATLPPMPVVASAAMPETVMESTAPLNEYGVDLGGARDLRRLRALWSTLRGQHGQLLDGLRPVVAVHKAPRRSATELRLVAGPLVNLAAATRLCAVLAATSQACQPSGFDDQQQLLP